MIFALRNNNQQGNSPFFLKYPQSASTEILGFLVFIIPMNKLSVIARINIFSKCANLPLWGLPFGDPATYAESKRDPARGRLLRFSHGYIHGSLAAAIKITVESNR